MSTSQEEKDENGVVGTSPTSEASQESDFSAAAIANLIGGFCAATATWGYTNAFGVYQDIYTRSRVQTASNIAWIGSTQLFFLLMGALPAGKLLDMGYFRQTLLAGSLLFTFSLFMVSLSHSYYQIYLSLGLGMGIGAGLIYVPVVAVQAHYWHRHRALAMGMVTMGSSVGGIFFPIMLNQLFKGSVGFDWGVRASAFLVLGLLAIANILMRSKTDVISRNKPKPDLKGVLTDIPFLLADFGCMIFNWGLFLPYFYLQLFAILHGVDPNVAFYTLAVMNGASVPGRMLPNILADRFGPFNAVLIPILACCALIFALFRVGSVASVMVFAVLYGFFSGAFLSLCGPVVASMARDLSEVGVRLGVAYAINSFGALSGPPIAGALVGDDFSWWKALVFGGVSSISGGLFIAVARQMVSARKSSQLV